MNDKTRNNLVVILVALVAITAMLALVQAHNTKLYSMPLETVECGVPPSISIELEQCQRDNLLIKERIEDFIEESLEEKRQRENRYIVMEYEYISCMDNLLEGCLC